MLVSWSQHEPSNLRFTRMQNLEFAFYPTPTPDASQWNIGGIGSPTQNFRVGHVHFMLFMSISFASGTQRKLVFQWNMGSNFPHRVMPYDSKTY